MLWGCCCVVVLVIFGVGLWMVVIGKVFLNWGWFMVVVKMVKSF